MNILGSETLIGNTGKTGWVDWCDYVPSTFGYPYKLVAKLDGREVGSKIIGVTGKETSIIIPISSGESDLGGINFTSIRLNYIGVIRQDSSGQYNFRLPFQGSKGRGEQAQGSPSTTLSR